MTPVADWTMAYQNWIPTPSTQRLVIRLRRFCSRNCQCVLSTGKKERSEETEALWDELESNIGLSLPEELGQPKTPDNVKTTMKKTLKDSTKAIFGKFRQKVAGFLPDDLEPSYWRDPNARADPLNFRAATCSNLECDYPSDCASMSTPSCPLRPVCVVDPSSRTSMVSGTLDKVVFFATALCVRQHTRSQLNGRDLEAAPASDSWPCACNITYISHSCCTVPNGMVWEAPHLMLGELKV
jgi:hypothetical protein